MYRWSIQKTSLSVAEKTGDDSECAFREQEDKPGSGRYFHGGQ